MNFKNFIELIRKEIEKSLGEGYEVKVDEVMKNNHVVLTGLTIVEPQINISPIIYLDDYYESYIREDKGIEEILEDILEVYDKNSIRHTVDMDFFTNFEQVREHIVYKLINYEKNAIMLEDVPYIPFHDLAIVFQCLVSNDKYGSSSIMIHHAHLKLWGVTKEELYQHAKKNMPRLYPYELKGVRDMILDMMRQTQENMMEMDELLNESDTVPLYVLTNTNRMNGASSLLYQDIIRDFATAADKNVFILPSSIHEVLLMLEEGEESVELLKQMVHEVNETELEAEEFLSEHIYYYNRNTNQISMY